MMSQASIAAAMLTGWMLLTTPVWAASFFFNTGTPDGKLGALSRRPSGGKIETETADDFILSETTVIDRATIVGLLIPSGTTLADIENVEVELYHVFPKDSDATRTPNVPTRTNSPGDVEIGAATRDASEGTLDFSASLLSSPFTVANSVIDGINKKPNNVTLGEGPQTGEEVQIDITFNEPIVLPADHYFFRPEALVTGGGDFLYLSAPKPTAPPLFVGDLQAWIRNSDLAPDWLRIGTDIIGGNPAPQFNMTFSLTGETVPAAGTPGAANCQGKTTSALAKQFGGIDGAAKALGFSSVEALQDAFKAFCKQ